jgi:hypothetical protein
MTFQPLTFGNELGPLREDSPFRLPLQRTGALIRNAELRRCALVIAPNPRGGDRVYVETYRSEGQRPVSMFRPATEIAGLFDVDARDAAMIAALSRLPAFDAFTLDGALPAALDPFIKNGSLSAAEVENAVPDLSRETRDALSDRISSFVTPLCAALIDGAKPASENDPRRRVIAAADGKDPDARSALLSNGRRLARALGESLPANVSDHVETMAGTLLVALWAERIHSAVLRAPLKTMLFSDARLRGASSASAPALGRFVASLRSIGDRFVPLLSGTTGILIGHVADGEPSVEASRNLDLLAGELAARAGSLIVEWTVRIDAWNAAMEDGKISDDRTAEAFVSGKILPGLELVDESLAALVSAFVRARGRPSKA